MSKINQKAVKTIAKLIENGFDTEKEIVSMTIDDMLELPGISVQELNMINAIQKAVKGNRIITFLAGKEKDKIENDRRE